MPIIDRIFTARPITWPIDADAYRAAPGLRENGPWRMDDWRLEDVAHWTTWCHVNPEVVRCLWRAVDGFQHGRVLDCSGGGDAFTAMAPAGAAVTRIEPLADNVHRAAELHPHADVRWEFFPDSDLPADHFDVVVGSVSFGSRYSYHRELREGFGLQERFLLKALEGVRPGGIVAVVTSTGLLDDEDASARRVLSESADLLGAVRLPNHIHTRFSESYSGEDIVILRRRSPGAEPLPCAWKAAKPIRVDGHTMHINEYFVEHAGHVLGRLAVHTSWGSPQWLEVRGDLSYAPGQLRHALADVTRGVAAPRHDELWDAYRRTLCVLGDERAARLLRAVGEVRSDQGVSIERLRGRAATAFATLDDELAQRAWNLDCDLPIAEDKGREAEGRLALANAQLARAVGRDDRDKAEGQIRTWAYSVEHHTSAATRIRQAREFIGQESRHPDRWWDPHGLWVARWVARERINQGRTRP